jgi:hypothetical protein
MILVKIHTMKIPTETTAGLSARIPHTTDFVVFLDYDNITDERLQDELTYLQELFRLGDFYIFATNEFGRHAICIDRLALRDAMNVLEDSTCDWMFKKGVGINEYRTWILRAIGKGERPKPKYQYTVESPYNGQRIQSQAHGEFLQRHCQAPIRLMNPDRNDELEIQGYRTSSKTSMKDVEKKNE